MASPRSQMEALRLGTLDAEEAASLVLLHEHGISPQEIAFQKCLIGVDALLRKHDISVNSDFISYAWEEQGSAELARLHTFLKRLSKDLGSLGRKVFLDIENMTGRLEATMRTEIFASDYFLLIGSPRYKQRAAEQTSVAFEYRLMSDKINQSPTPQSDKMLLPVWYSGTFDEAFPPGVSEHLIRDFRNPQQYYHGLLGLSEPVGLIPHLYPVLAKGGLLHAEYRSLLDAFESQLKFLGARQEVFVSQGGLTQEQLKAQALQSLKSGYCSNKNRVPSVKLRNL